MGVTNGVGGPDGVGVSRGVGGGGGVGGAGGRAAARAEAQGAQTGPGRRAGSCTAAQRAAMAGYVPGLLPADSNQEKEFVQAYEDVLERYKGTATGGARRGAWSAAGPPRGG